MSIKNQQKKEKDNKKLKYKESEKEQIKKTNIKDNKRGGTEDQNYDT
jgi:hypothetical protein